MAAGSVISEPNSGAKVRMTNQRAAVPSPSSHATPPSSRAAKAMTGRAAASVMMMKTNKGSTNLDGPTDGVPARTAA